MLFDHSYTPRESNRLPKGYKDGDGWDIPGWSPMHGKYITQLTQEELKQMFKNRVPSSQDCNVALPPESYVRTGEHMRSKAFKLAGDRWKTIESFQPPFGIPCYVHWNGWDSRVQDLLERDWIVTKVTNNYTGKVKLYVRDPVTKLMGAGELMEKKYDSGLPHSFSANLDYFCHEKNQRIRKFIQSIDAENIVTINEENMGIVLEYIADLQRKSAKPKKRPSRDPAEILQYIKIAS